MSLGEVAEKIGKDFIQGFYDKAHNSIIKKGIIGLYNSNEETLKKVKDNLTNYFDSQGYQGINIFIEKKGYCVDISWYLKNYK